MSAVGPPTRSIVVDANIIVRALLGVKALSILEKYSAHFDFVAPVVALSEVRDHLPGIVGKRGMSSDVSLRTFDDPLQRLLGIISLMPHASYAPFEQEARLRLWRRDEDDWPFLALALALGCPIWTEDRDFFGVGVATWTTDRIEVYLDAETVEGV